MLWWHLRKLRSADVEQRRRAVQAVTAARTPKALEALAGALGDSDPAVRSLAARALLATAAERPGDRIRTDGAVAALHEILTGAEPAAADLAATVLVEAGAAHPDVITRRGVAKALGSARTARALETLLALMQDRDPDVRDHAARGLGSARHHAAERVLLEEAGRNAGALWALVALGTPAAIGRAVAVLEERHEKLPSALVAEIEDKLASLSDSAARDVLRRALLDAITQGGAKQHAAPRAIRTLDRADPDWRQSPEARAAVTGLAALADIGDGQALELLAEVVQPPAAEALVRIFVSALRGTTIYSIRAGARGLRRICHEPATVAERVLLAHADDRDSIAKMGEDAIAVALAERDLPAWRRIELIARSGTPALPALLEVARGTACPELREIAVVELASWAKAGRSGAQVFPVLVGLVSDEQSSVRQRAIYELSQDRARQSAEMRTALESAGYGGDLEGGLLAANRCTACGTTLTTTTESRGDDWIYVRVCVDCGKRWSGVGPGG